MGLSIGTPPSQKNFLQWKKARPSSENPSEIRGNSCCPSRRIHKEEIQFHQYEKNICTQECKQHIEQSKMSLKNWSPNQPIYYQTRNSDNSNMRTLPLFQLVFDQVSKAIYSSTSCQGLVVLEGNEEEKAM